MILGEFVVQLFLLSDKSNLFLLLIFCFTFAGVTDILQFMLVFFARGNEVTQVGGRAGCLYFCDPKYERVSVTEGSVLVQICVTSFMNVP